MKKFFSIVIAAMIVLIAAFFWFINAASPVHPPDRVAGIPADATWVGGADGGQWYQLVDSPGKDLFHIRIYHDYTGEVDADALFVLSQDCGLKGIDSTNLIQYINWYDGSKIGLMVAENNRYCILTPIEPMSTK